MDKANLILAPYNYIVDTSIRHSLELDKLIEGAVIVFDEGHNIENIAEGS